MAGPVIDPALLAQLNAGDGPKPVSDPAILAQLNGGDHPSVTEDVLKSGGTGLAKGVIGLAGLPGDASNLLAKGSKVASDYIADKLGIDKGPEPTAPVLPTSEGIQKGIEGVTGDFHKPQTMAGEYAQTFGEFAPAALGGGEGLMARLVKQVAAPAVASETAGQVTKGTAAEPYARVAGAVAGGGLASALSRSPAAVAPTVDELKDSYRSGISHPEVQAVTFKPSSLSDLNSTIRTDLEKRGFRDRRETNTFADINELSNPNPTLARAAGAPATVDDIESIRKSLGKTAQELGPDFRPTSDAAAATAAVKHIDRWFDGLKQPDLLSGDISKAAPIMKDARGDYAAAMRAENIQNKIGNAKIQAGSSYSGGNINNATRQALKPLAKNDFAKAGGYNDAEKAQLAKAIMGNVVGNTARAVGKLAPDSGLKAMEHVAAAYGTGGASIPASLASLAAKMGGDYATNRNVKKLDEMLRSRSPLHQAQTAPMINAPGPPGFPGYRQVPNPNYVPPTSKVGAVPAGLLAAALASQPYRGPNLGPLQPRQ